MLPAVVFAIRSGTNNSIARDGLLQRLVALLRCYVRGQDRTNLATSGSGFQVFLIVTTEPQLSDRLQSWRITCESRLKCFFVFGSRTDLDLFALPSMA